MRKNYKSQHVYIGWRTPQILVQFMPFQWGLGAGLGGRKLGLCIGPFQLVLFWGAAAFEKGTS